jgi:hypothetical protein
MLRFTAIPDTLPRPSIRAAQKTPEGALENSCFKSRRISLSPTQYSWDLSVEASSGTTIVG